MEGIFHFEDIDDALPLLPLAARRALDAVGQHLSLTAWQALPLEDRRTLVRAGSEPHVDTGSAERAVASASPPASAIAKADETDLDEPPANLVRVDRGRWAALTLLERFALRHLAGRKNPQRLREALAEIMPERPTHIDAQGDAHMVDVGEKTATHRRAVTSVRVCMLPTTLAMITHAQAPKGDVIATARIAGIMAAKRTSDLIPLCHPIALSRVDVAFELAQNEVIITATAEAYDRTGVEMEAMTAASVAALTIYDMLKGVERGIRIEHLVLVEKAGGRSGHYKREGTA